MDLQPAEIGPLKSDDPLIDGVFIEKDLGIGRRSRFYYRARGILPPPDANLLGRNLWRLSTYQQFRDDLFAGRFLKSRRAPSRRRSLQGLGSPTRAPHSATIE
jgi:hypothetical protein